MLLGDAKMFANVAVSDMAKGKDFYGGTLGLELVDENEGAMTFKSSEGKVMVYVSDTAGKGQATCVGWKVDDAKAVAEELSKKGVTFEHYDMPHMTRDGDIHSMGDFMMAWFKDPDGNVLAIMSGTM